MFGQYLIINTNQKILRLLAKFSDKEFYERQIARTLSIAYGSANNALNELYSTGAIRRRQEGKMYFYSVDSSNPIIVEFKRLLNLLLSEPLVEELKSVSNRVILYGSCAQGTDTSKSDMDLFIVSNNGGKVLDLVNDFKFPRGFDGIHIQAVIKSPVELLEIKEPEKVFIEEVELGIVVWERVAGESRV